METLTVSIRATRNARAGADRVSAVFWTIVTVIALVSLLNGNG